LTARGSLSLIGRMGRHQHDIDELARMAGTAATNGDSSPGT
jgi:hypothetical protein